MVGTGRGATAGVLVKHAEALEVLEKVDTVVVDKTGTLTEGRPRLATLVALPPHDEAELLRLAASLERGSEHPLAGAIVGAARERGLALEEAADFRAVPGQGVSGRVGGRRVALGNAKLLGTLGVEPGDLGRAGRCPPPGGADRGARRGRRSPGGSRRRGRPDQGLDPGGAPGAPRRRDPRRHGHRGQPRHGGGGRPDARDRRGRGRGPARSEGRHRQAAPGRGPHRGDGGRRDQRRARRWRRPTSGSRWAPAPTSRWRARTSRW